MNRGQYTSNRGDIIWLVFDPRVGHEQSGRRPALVLSPQMFTERTGLAVVCPITSKIKGLPFEIVLKRTKTEGAVVPIHVRSIDVIAKKCSFIEKAPVSVLNRTARSVTVMISSL